MRNTLTMKVRNAGEHLLEAALDLAGTHPTLLDRSIEITTRAELHDFTPVLRLVLDEVDRLDDVDVV
jgi:hypothetical protein